MLIDIGTTRLSQDPIDALINGDASLERLAVGVYEAGWSFDRVLEDAGLLVSEYPFKPWKGEEFPRVGSGPGEVTQAEAAKWWEEYGTRPEDFGVCDNWEQITTRWPLIVSSDRKFVISLSRVTKAAQSPSGGWRWHKWGEYIGTKDPQHEYLYDEGPEIEAVFTFHIYEVKGADQ
jgi:hypothetical protein